MLPQNQFWNNKSLLLQMESMPIRANISIYSKSKGTSEKIIGI